MELHDRIICTVPAALIWSSLFVRKKLWLSSLYTTNPFLCVLFTPFLFMCTIPYAIVRDFCSSIEYCRIVEVDVSCSSYGDAAAMSRRGKGTNIRKKIVYPKPTLSVENIASMKERSSVNDNIWSAMENIWNVGVIHRIARDKYRTSQVLDIHY